MDPEIVPATTKDAPIFRSLMQLYAYDFSEFMGWDVDSDGRFDEKGVEPLRLDPLRHPFLIRAKGHVAGFVLVDRQSRLFAAEPANDMAEFFVLRKYRRQGVGARVAVCVFDLFPGRWEVRQTARNTLATAFWRKVIGAYSGGNFQEVVWNDERWCGPVQIFNCGQRLGPAPGNPKR
jgi:predicted acetyltransferase